MTTVLAIVIILLVLAYFYLKCSPLTSLATLMTLIVVSIISYTYYEYLANLLIGWGRGIQWAHAGCFVLLFVVSFSLLRTLSETLIGSAAIDLGTPIKVGTAIVCGLLSGIIVCGNLFVAMGLLPVQHKFFYNRFALDAPVAMNQPQEAFLNTDGFVTGLYSLVSRGSLSSSKSFAVFHDDFLSQIHLNRIGVKNNVLTVASPKSLTLPSGEGKKPVRLWENLPDHGKATVVRIGISASDIQSGGAGNPADNNKVEFYPAQIRMVCKEPSATPTKPWDGIGKAFWPIGFLKDGKLIPTKLDELVPPSVKTVKDRIVWLDVVFETPQNDETILLQFKQNAMITLPSAIRTTDEIEKNLDSTGDETGL